MEPPPHSTWDLAAIRRSDRRLVEPTLLELELRRRAKRRIAAFERTAALLDSHVLSEPVAAGTLRRLGENYRFRSSRWAGRRRQPSRTVERLTMFAGVVLACVPGVVAFLLGSKMVPLFAGLGIFLGSPAFLVVAYRRRFLGDITGIPAIDQTVERFSERRCADCGHDLKGLPPGLPPDLMEGTDVGPRACPECGIPWPLVPP